MILIHPKGLYSINYYIDKKMVYEVPIGIWTRSDYEEYHNQFIHNIGPTISKEPWVLVTDLRKYKLSDLTDVMSDHTDWLAKNNLKYAAIVLDTPIIKMQINRAVSTKFPQQAFFGEEEAVAWLKTKGF